MRRASLFICSFFLYWYTIDIFVFVEFYSFIQRLNQVKYKIEDKFKIKNLKRYFYKNAKIYF